MPRKINEFFANHRDRARGSITIEQQNVFRLVRVGWRIYRYMERRVYTLLEIFSTTRNYITRISNFHTRYGKFRWFFHGRREWQPTTLGNVYRYTVGICDSVGFLNSAVREFVNIVTSGRAPFVWLEFFERFHFFFFVWYVKDRAPLLRRPVNEYSSHIRRKARDRLVNEPKNATDFAPSIKRIIMT